MAEIKLAAQVRTEFGKGAARRTRREQLIPAVLYGHGTDPLHIALPGHETLLALRSANALLGIQLPDGSALLALPKQVQRHPIRDLITHVDLIIVKRGEQVTVEVPLVLVGTPEPDTVVMQVVNIVAVQAEITAIPGELELSVEHLAVGDQRTLADIELPKGIQLIDDPETLAVATSMARTSEEIEAAIDAADAEREETTEAAPSSAE